jgi:hypothetical protein
VCISKFCCMCMSHDMCQVMMLTIYLKFYNLSFCVALEFSSILQNGALCFFENISCYNSLHQVKNTEPAVTKSARNLTKCLVVSPFASCIYSAFHSAPLTRLLLALYASIMIPSLTPRLNNVANQITRSACDHHHYRRQARKLQQDSNRTVNHQLTPNSKQATSTAFDPCTLAGVPTYVKHVIYASPPRPF